MKRWCAFHYIFALVNRSMYQAIVNDYLCRAPSVERGTFDLLPFYILARQLYASNYSLSLYVLLLPSRSKALNIIMCNDKRRLLLTLVW